MVLSPFQSLDPDPLGLLSIRTSVPFYILLTKLLSQHIFDRFCDLPRRSNYCQLDRLRNQFFFPALASLHRSRRPTGRQW